VAKALYRAKHAEFSKAWKEKQMREDPVAWKERQRKYKEKAKAKRLAAKKGKK